MKPKKDMLSEAREIEDAIEAGKIRGKAIAKAKRKAYGLRHRAALKTQKAQKAVKGPKASRKAKKIDKRQGLLPSFVDQIHNPSFEEMTAEYIRSTMQQAIEQRVGQILDNVLPFKKAQ